MEKLNGALPNLRELPRDNTQPERKSKTREVVIPWTEETLREKMQKVGVSPRYLSAKGSDLSENLKVLFRGFGKGQGYFIHGVVGTGKTHIAVALMRDYIEKRPDKQVYGREDNIQPMRVSAIPPRMTSTPDLLMEIRQVFSGQTLRTEGEIIRDYGSVRLLILDDIGVEKATEWTLQTLYSIIDQRYREMRQTVITSNLSLEQLADKVGDRIVSRIAGMCEVIELKGRDRRLG